MKNELSERRDAIRLLVSYGADRTSPDERGRTALEVFHAWWEEENRKENPEIYDEIEKLLTPDEEKKSPPNVSEKATPTEILIAKADVVVQKDIAQNDTAAKDVPKKSELQVEQHLQLNDMSDDW